jgi:hypothetical protein
MSQVTQPTISLPTHARPRRVVWLGALLALAAGAAVVLVLALGSESPDNAAPVAAQAQPSLRSDSGPEETSVATAVGSQPVLGPDESRTATAVSGSSSRTTGATRYQSADRALHGPGARTR